MANTYLVKKDPALPCSDENWMIMSYKEYKKWTESSEGSSRKIIFGKILPATENDNVIYIECDEEKEKKCQEDINKKKYIRKYQKELGYKTISYHSNDLDETECSEEMLLDTESDIEEEVISKLILDQLSVAVQLLSYDEKALIEKMFLCRFPLSEREYAKELGVVPSVVNYRKKAILTKLRKFLEKE